MGIPALRTGVGWLLSIALISLRAFTVIIVTRSLGRIMKNARSFVSSQSNVTCNTVSEGRQVEVEARGQSRGHWNTRNRFCVGGTTCCVIAKISPKENQPNLFSRRMEWRRSPWACGPSGGWVTVRHRSPLSPDVS